MGSTSMTIAESLQTAARSVGEAVRRAPANDTIRALVGRACAFDREHPLVGKIAAAVAVAAMASLVARKTSR